MTKEERKENFRLQCLAELQDETVLDQKERSIMIEDFINYWTESGLKKLRFEYERTFEITKRFATWKRNHDKWNKQTINKNYGQANNNSSKANLDLLNESARSVLQGFTGNINK